MPRGRPKGSKNKSKTGKPVEALVAPRTNPSPGMGHPPPERVDAYPEVTQATTEACLKLAEEYGATGIPPNVEMAIHAIRLAYDLPCALIVKHKAEQKMLVSMLAAWGRGAIPGKVSESSIQDKIEAALYWAKVNDENGNTEQATKQRARAAKFQQELEEFQKKSDD